MDVEDELQMLRQEVAELRELIDRLGEPPPQGNKCLVGITATKNGYPNTNTPPRWYWIQRQSVGGTESEGGTAVLTPTDTAAGGFFALNIGTRRPPPGTRVEINDTGQRFTFNY